VAYSSIAQTTQARNKTYRTIAISSSETVRDNHDVTRHVHGMACSNRGRRLSLGRCHHKLLSTNEMSVQSAVATDGQSLTKYIRPPTSSYQRAGVQAPQQSSIDTSDCKHASINSSSQIGGTARFDATLTWLNSNTRTQSPVPNRHASARPPARPLHV